ncbi:MAG: amidase [Dehalococcoidia bacterium]
MTTQELLFLSVTELGKLIQNRELSPVELTQAHLEQIDRLDGTLRAYITVTREEALGAAKDAEEAIRRGSYLGPLHGIPFAVKDQIYTQGIRTTACAKFLSDFVPQEDATVVTRLKEAGGVLLGKLNMTELALGGGAIFNYGVPRNPWNPDYYPGSSSCGSGIAPAAGMAVFTLGEDTGGSIRNPANMCGIVGLRPTQGRVSRHGVVPAIWSADTLGPLARTVEECALVLRAIAGHDHRDSLTSQVPVPDYRSFLDGDVQGMRLGVVKELMESDLIHPEVRQAFQEAVRLFSGLGASVEEVSIPLTSHAGTIYLAGLEPEISLSPHLQWLRTRWHEYGYGSRTRVAAAALMPAAIFNKGMRARTLLRNQVLEALQRVDVLLSSSSPAPPPTIEEETAKMQGDLRTRTYMGPRHYTSVHSLASVPALTILMGFSSQGLPLGLQIAGRPFEEGTVFKVAHVYEQATPWHTRRPPLAAPVT